MNENTRYSDPVKEWLGAYLDGELNQDRRAWVEEHLAGCAACQAELEALGALNVLLHADPPPLATTSAPAFVKQVLRALPQPEQPRWQRWLNSSLRYLPLGLVGAWAFLEAVLLVSSLLLLGQDYLPGLRAMLSPLLPYQGAAPSWEVTGWLVALELGLVALFAALFAAWLAVYWSHSRTQALHE